MENVFVDWNKINEIIDLLKSDVIPSEQESSTHSFSANFPEAILSNSYLAIVAICHQTSPIGERRLEGIINQNNKIGWDYLKEKFLLAVVDDEKWATVNFWAELTPPDLSMLYEDQREGKTLNRINERTFLLNNLGDELKKAGFQYIEEAFSLSNNYIEGNKGFLNFLKKFEAYKDPAMKKAMFFLSIMSKECRWSIADKENLLSPVDYHELRGHLRIGTVIIKNNNLSKKIEKELVLKEDEDLEIRLNVQKANDFIGRETGLSSSVIHYLLWNIFRNCCPRDAQSTHCKSCGTNCKLPKDYKSMLIYKDKCGFALKP